MPECTNEKARRGRAECCSSKLTIVGTITRPLPWHCYYYKAAKICKCFVINREDLRIVFVERFSVVKSYLTVSISCATVGRMSTWHGGHSS